LKYVLLDDGPLKLSATFFETRAILEWFKRSSNLLVYAGEREVVGRISKISYRVEWFFDTQPVMRLLLQRVAFVPTLLFTWNRLSFLDWYHMLCIVEDVAVISKEVENELPQAFVVVFAETAQFF
jgi:hypothetical protein